MVETVKEVLQMSKQTGLSDSKRFEAFTRQWRDSALKEAEKWCPDDRAAQLLADAVLAAFRNKYAENDPPPRPEYLLRALSCLIYSQTGQSVRKLEDYIAAQQIPEEEDAPPEEAPAEEPAPPVVQPQPEPPAQSETVPGEGPIPAQAETSAPVQAEVTDAPTPAAPSEAQVNAPVADSMPAKPQDTPPDTFIDPVRTAFWTPGSGQTSHVIKELELPDGEEDGRSVLLSFLNTVLFVLTVGAFGFCFYETGFLQYLMQ